MFKENILKVVVFDLGGTLMQYIGMPYSWVDFYYQGFNAIAEKYCSDFPPDKIQASVDILKRFNPRVNYRENEYSAGYIFSTALETWNLNVSIASHLPSTQNNPYTEAAFPVAYGAT